MCSVGALAGNLFAAAPFTFSYTAGSLGSVRFNHTATLLQNGKVLVAGGGNSGSNPFLSTAELFDPANGTWSAATSMAVARRDHTATLLTNGKVLVAGGYNDFGYLDTAQLYDPGTGSWNVTANNLTTARAFHTTTLLANGKVLLVGGLMSMVV